MNELVDLHVHSNYSCDGDHTPAELTGFAAATGYRAISIADHDTVAAYPGAFEAGRKSGVEVIPGIELTTVFKGREFHLLLPLVDWQGGAIGKIVEAQSRRRVNEAKARVEKVRGLGFNISWEEVDRKTNGVPPLGVRIAQILLDDPENRGNSALEYYYREENAPRGPYLFYRDYFAEGKPAYIPKNFMGLEEALAAAPGTGGVPVLAHPGAYFEMATADELKFLKGLGLAGLEVYTSYHTPEQVAQYRGLADELGLIPTAGSDFHGRIKPHVAFGGLRDGAYWMVEKIREEADKRGKRGQQR